MPAPNYKIIRLLDGVLAFGSRWEGGVIPKHDWVARLKNGDIDLKEISPLLSKIYAFDHFIHNIDRHAGNFLVRGRKQGYSFLAFDYSRAWIVHGLPLPGLPFLPNRKTILLQQQITNYFGRYIDSDVSRYCVDNIKTIGKDLVGSIIDGHPSLWLPDKQKEDILDWWQSADFVSRLESIAQGIENGTFL